jgi:stringent starvation protein B
MLPIKPYMLQACYDWICDSGLTPQLLVDATLSGVQVPTEYVQDNLIILNISPTAVRELDLMGEPISFSARFGGSFRSIILPLDAVQVIYARESRQGIALSSFDEGFVMPSENNSSIKEDEKGNFEEKKRDTPSKVKKPNLKLVD